jgi:transcriptional regulator with XRE-family HTH domain
MTNQVMTLAECRKEAGLTQGDMARALGISGARYSRIESDPSNLTIRQARNICSVIGRPYESVSFSKPVNG